jgi:hypothetical protein
MLHSAAAQQCTGYLPGNCRFEEGVGFMHCNAGAFCETYGFPAQHNACESVDTCDAMCAAAAQWGGECRQEFSIDWQLDCDGQWTNVKVMRAEMQIPGYGTVHCDDRIQVATTGAVVSAARGGRRMLRGVA